MDSGMGGGYLKSSETRFPGQGSFKCLLKNISLVNSTCLKAYVTEKEMAFYIENLSLGRGKEKSALISLFYECPSTFRMLQKD